MNRRPDAVHLSWIPVLAEGEGGGGGMNPLFILVAIGLIFYFIVIRPSSKERKNREAQVKALKKHDKVVTNAGIHGTVVSMDDETVTLRVDEKNNIRIRFSRSAVWSVQTEATEPKKEKTANGKTS